MNTPQIVDTALANAHSAANAIKSAIAQKKYYIKDYEKSSVSYKAISIAKLEVDIAKLEAELAPVSAEIASLNAQYTGWTRAFLVANGNGHVHTSMGCGTCYITTQFMWLPEWSGKDEAEIIDAAGSSACTVCFPNAPVEKLSQPSRIQDPAKVAMRAEREAKRLAKEAKAIATGITNPDGSALKINGWVLKTERTAQIEGVDALVWNAWYPEGGNFAKNAENFAQIAAALAFKRGTSIDEQVAILTAKAEKKVAA